MTLSDAIQVTGATSGKVLSEYSITVNALTNPQKTAVVNFITSLGAWPGVAGHIFGVTVARTYANPNTISCTISGFIVHNDGDSAVNARSADDKYNLLGKVP